MQYGLPVVVPPPVVGVGVTSSLRHKHIFVGENKVTQLLVLDLFKPPHPPPISPRYNVELQFVLEGFRFLGCHHLEISAGVSLNIVLGGKGEKGA